MNPFLFAYLFVHRPLISFDMTDSLHFGKSFAAHAPILQESGGYVHHLT